MVFDIGGQRRKESVLGSNVELKKGILRQVDDGFMLSFRMFKKHRGI
jgi:hypothetical protein